MRITIDPSSVAVLRRVDEILMTKEIPNPNSKWQALAPDAIIRSFALRHSFETRHSDFVIVQSLLTSAATIL